MKNVTKIHNSQLIENLMFGDSISTITNRLISLNIPYFKHHFSSIYGTGCNIIVEFNYNAKEDILVTAHHDGIGIFDNNGGILLMLNILEAFEPQNNYNYRFIFTDKEESFQQGIKYFIKDYYLDKLCRIKYHLNIDGIGVGESLVLYPNKSFHLNNWVKNDLTILLTDCLPITQLNLQTFHMFSCYSYDADLVIKSQSLSDNLSKYLNNEWCVQNFKWENISTLTDKTTTMLSEIDTIFSKKTFEQY